MKKTLLTLILFLLTICVFAQKKTKEERQAELDEKKAFTKYVPRDSLNYPTKYCLLLAYGKFMSNKVDIRIDYGQDSSFFEDTMIRDKNGKKITFHSVIDALNYMESIGWEFIDAYAITIGNQNVYHYLLKSNSETEETFIPKTKADFKKE